MHGHTKLAHSVHPHACGENDCKRVSRVCPDWSTPTRVGKTVPVTADTYVNDGPPPRVWGKRILCCNVVCHYTVHPHACGENHVDHEPTLRITGPPPRVWGKPTLLGSGSRMHRSTPTRVGKTYVGRISEAFENGPPPRVWGKRKSPRACTFLLRSTPTRVGKTFIACLFGIRSTVHPHACGENAGYLFPSP